MPNGYLSEEYHRYINSPEWGIKRLAVRRRERGRCQRCGKSGGLLDVHHCHYNTFGREDVNDPNTLQLLCRPCHELADAERRGERVPDLDELDRACLALNRTINHYVESRAHVGGGDDDVTIEHVADDGDDDEWLELKRKLDLQ